MLPIVALIGRKNVGKSTLFNRLTRARDALVANFPGLTCDRKYGHVKVHNLEFVCIDTGGIDIKRDGIEKCVTEQSLLAIEEADVILFIVDARTGLMPEDLVIAKYLRSCKKSICLVANKTDGIDIDQAIIDFWTLGFGKIHPISASHGRGVTSLLETVLLSFINSVKLSRKVNLLRKIDEDVENLVRLKKSKSKSKKSDRDKKIINHLNPLDLPIKLAIVGRPNVGKSTLINCILGKNRVVVYDMPGTTRDSIYIPIERNKFKYVLIDTAGVRKKSNIINVIEKFSVIKTLQAIEDSNVVLLVIDAREGISDQDLCLLRIILNKGRSLVIVVNKWDNLAHSIREKVKETLHYRLNFINFVRVHFISAIYGHGVSNLFKSVREAYNSSTCRRSTNMVTNIMNMATANHQPPLVHGRRIRLKYAHIGGYNPPIVVIHGNQVKDLSESYKRYLMDYFCKSLDIKGTPIRILFKEGMNPFTNKRNALVRVRKLIRRYHFGA